MIFKVNSYRTGFSFNFSRRGTKSYTHDNVSKSVCFFLHNLGSWQFSCAFSSHWGGNR